MYYLMNAINLLNAERQITLFAQFCVPWRSKSGGPGWYCPADPPGFGSGTGDVSSLGGILTSVMDYVFVIAGLLLLFMIIASGYTLLTSAGNPEAMTKGKSRLTAALIGFIIVFAAFWIFQIIEVLLGGTGVFTPP